MTSRGLSYDVWRELRGVFARPHPFAWKLLGNGVVSLAFFMVSLALGTNNPTLLPLAATIMLLWTFADATLTNQLILGDNRSAFSEERYGNLRRFWLVKNLAAVILSVPLCVLFGLIMVAIVGEWSELTYGLLMAVAMIWGWLGIGNALSVVLPFRWLATRAVLHRRNGWLRYAVLYALPWVLLPVYGLVLELPFVLAKWATGAASVSHRFAAFAVVLAISVAIWLLGLRVAVSATRRPQASVWSLLSQND
jgi:hypothetical protein